MLVVIGSAKRWSVPWAFGGRERWAAVRHGIMPRILILCWKGWSIMALTRVGWLRVRILSAPAVIPKWDIWQLYHAGYEMHFACIDLHYQSWITSFRSHGFASINFFYDYLRHLSVLLLAPPGLSRFRHFMIVMLSENLHLQIWRNPECSEVLEPHLRRPCSSMMWLFLVCCAGLNSANLLRRLILPQTTGQPSV